ncbi:MAG TPA: efflux RND transporter periplasmic adaptor subunit [Aquabacterium sp.]|nr:efflux RND transporter periplasmic adaptor subunit [Aquabacterium sp.]
MLKGMKIDLRSPLACLIQCLPALAMAASSGTVELSPQQEQRLGIQTTSARPVSQSHQLFPAQVVLPPDRQWLVSAPAAGLIQSMTVREGDPVRKGQILVRLHSVQAQNLQLDWQSAKSQADWAQTQYQRDQALFKEGLISQSRLESSKAQAQQASSQEAQKRQVWQDASGRAATTQGGIAVQAPEQGWVLEQLATLGQRVEAMAPLYRVGHLNPIWVDIQVPAAQAGRIQTGSAVSVSVPGSTNTAVGRITGSAATVHQATQTVRLYAQVQNPDLQLKPGQLTQVAVASDGSVNATLVPSSAILTHGKKTQVFVRKAPGRYQLQDVDILSQGADGATARGLPAESQVVFKGTAALQSLISE